jgi:cytochrome c peroxidase
VNKKVLIIVVLIITFIAVAASGGGTLQPLGPVPVPDTNPQTVEKIELGKKLFFDRRLSGDGTMSCVTCHAPEMAFSDGQEISFSYPTTRNWRNAPTLINIGYLRNIFHDGRASSLEQQALFPVMSSFEMNLNHDYMEEKLRIVPEYVEAFNKIFGGDITRERVAMAIAAFERSLVSANVPLDKYLKGDETVLSDDAKKGLEIFTGKGNCIDCHNGQILSDEKFHALAVPENPQHLKDERITATRRFVAKMNNYPDYKTLNEDLGRYLITKNPKDRKAFRTPTLREIGKTAPYMHNGIFATLEEVIDFFDNGGSKENTALKPLGLSKEEKRQLKVFLVEALSGDDIKMSSPVIP